MRADITFGEQIFIHGEVTTKDWRVDVGWRVFWSYRSRKDN